MLESRSTAGQEQASPLFTRNNGRNHRRGCPASRRKYNSGQSPAVADAKETNCARVSRRAQNQLSQEQAKAGGGVCGVVTVEAVKNGVTPDNVGRLPALCLLDTVVGEDGTVDKGKVAAI